MYVVSPQGSVDVTPDTINTTIGSNVLLNCSSLGGPDNRYRWIHVTTGAIAGNASQLSLNLTSATQFGEYQCIVTNDAGSDNDSSTINSKLIKYLIISIIN